MAFVKTPSLGPNQRLKILFSAYRLDKDFTLEELAVQSWKLYPSDFGMTKYPFPDVIRVYSRVHGERGLIKSGMLKCVDERPRGSLYRLSRKGFWCVCRSALPAEVLNDNQRKEREQKQQQIEQEEREGREREHERRREQRERRAAAKAARHAKKLVETLAEKQGKQPHSLEAVQQVHQNNASSTRRDEGRRMESPDSKKRSTVNGDRGAPERTGNAAGVFVQRIEAGRIVEGGAGEAGGSEEAGHSAVQTVQASPGKRTDVHRILLEDTANSPVLSDTEEKPKPSLVACFYCGAGTSPKFIDPHKNPMCGGCQRDKGFGIPTPKRWRPRPSGERKAVKLASVSKKNDAAVAKAEKMTVPDFTVPVPTRYVIRKFDKVRLGGHSHQCIEADGRGCIVMCPLRMAWEADGRPVK